MKLIIVESPNKIHTISNILGQEYTVLATAGHITLIKPDFAYHTGIDIKNNFKISFEFDPKKKDMLKKIKDAAKKADEIFVCSDPDREGESIADEVRFLLSDQSSKLKRAKFNEITPHAVKDAIAHPIPFDENRIQAAEARQILDRLIGYRLSPVSRQVGCESAGRVQSALLQLICKKEHEINAFIPTKYFDISIDFKKDNKNYCAKLKQIDGKKVDKVTDANTAKACIEYCNKNNYTISLIDSKIREVQPKLPFTSATLQQAASNILGFSPSKTRQCAQHLFEHAYITYHRTDAVRYSDDFIHAAKNWICKFYGERYYRGIVIPKSANDSAQNGHESVRPTDLENTPDKISQLVEPAEYKLYKLIYEHTLAAFFKPAKVQDDFINIKSGPYVFILPGKTIIEPSFLKFYNPDIKEEKLPVFKVGEILKDVKISSEEKETLPPPRYSEAGLVKLMKDVGIGRPSTYAGAIETLKKREYINVEKRAVHATTKGLKLNDMLQKYFSSIINTEYTANMETDLDKIAEGNETKLHKLTDFWRDFEPTVLNATKMIKKDRPEAEVYEGAVCPKCGGELHIKEGKYGKFVCCSKYPRCKFTASLDKDWKIIPPKEKTPVKDTGVICPKCKKGHLVERVASKTNEVFYGCSKFPKCKFTIKKSEFDEKYKNRE